MDRKTGPYRLFVTNEIGKSGQPCSIKTHIPSVRSSFRPGMLLVSGTFLILLVTWSVRAQGKLVAIGQDSKPVTATREVVCVRKKERPPVKVPMDLQVGDKLISDRRKLTAKISCGNGSASLNLLAPFRLQFIARQLKGCYVGYSTKPGGEMNVQASGPTGVSAAGVKMESKQTRYGIRIDRAGKRLRRQWLVYEGEVTVRSGRFFAAVKQGDKLVALSAGRPTTEKITRDDIQRAAEVYARIDVSQIPLFSLTSNTAFARLVALHEAVLANPKDQQPLRQLVIEQKELGIPVDPLNRFPSDSGAGSQALNYTLKANARTVHAIEIIACEKTHKYRITLENLPFARLVSPAESSVSGGQNSEFKIEFDTTGVKPGNYQGKIFVPCLDCYNNDCKWNDHRTVVVTIADQSVEPQNPNAESREKPVETVPATLPKKAANELREQAGALATPKNERPAEPPPDKSNTKPEVKVGDKESMIVTPATPRLDKETIQPGAETKKESAIEGPTKPPLDKMTVPAETTPEKPSKPGKPERKKPTPKREVWDIPLKPDTKTVLTLLVVNPCGKDRSVRVTPKDLPFVHPVSKTEIRVSGGQPVGVEFEFDTTGMKPGNYQGRFVLTCLDCYQAEPECTPTSQPKNLKVVATDVLPVNVNIK